MPRCPAQVGAGTGISVHVVISRLGAEHPAAREQEDRLAAHCAGYEGVGVLIVPHLYHLPETSPVWQRLAELAGPLVVASWLHPRPAEWLLRRHGIGAAGLVTLSLQAGDCLEPLRQALHDLGARTAAPGAPVPELPQSWEDTSPAGAMPPRWYPVVDLSRCSQCGHCLQFCLFGVYALDAEGHVMVANPDRCKAGCPACSRICPQGAIIFPLYEKDDAIAGAPGRLMAPDADARRMFYRRTGARCPVCGQEGTGTAPAPVGDRSACSECGRPTAPPQPADASSAVYDEIDALIADLDDLVEGRG